MEAQWKKAARSEGASNCIEVRSDLSAVRDSKNPAGPVLQAAGLIVAVKAGKFER